jgi:hypothetical protein
MNKVEYGIFIKPSTWGYPDLNIKIKSFKFKFKLNVIIWLMA